MLQVQITETKPVAPFTTPFNDDDDDDDHHHVVPLSHIDNEANLQVTFRYLRAYSTSSSISSDHDPFHVISSALSAALVRFYPLSGSLHRLPDGSLQILCSKSQTVPFIRATVDSTLASLSYLDDNPDNDFLEQLAPNPGPDEGLLRPCILQLTTFSCGGFTLGAAIHNSICDGLGASMFFNFMAEFARGIVSGGPKPAVQPLWDDREILLRPRDPPRVEAPIGEFLSLDRRFSPYEQDVGPVVKECFRFTDECLDRFKKELLDRSGLSFTTFEALGAFIWRAKVKAAKIPGDEIVKYTYFINIRKVVKPALPAGFWGNACVPMYVKLSAKDLVEKPLWGTIDLIKKSKRNATDEYVRSYIDFQSLHQEEGITAGREVSGFTDWRHLGHSTVDFGWGGPVMVLPLSKHFLGSVEPCYFLPYSSASGGKNASFKVSVTLREAAMPAFKAEMDKFGRGDFGLFS